MEQKAATVCQGPNWALRLSLIEEETFLTEDRGSSLEGTAGSPTPPPGANLIKRIPCFRTTHGLPGCI